MSGSDYTTTPNLGLYMPNYDMDDGTWGFHLNSNFATLDAAWATGGGGSMAGVTKTDRSGTITLANTAQTLMPANASRHGWSLQNKSNANLWFNDLGGAADPAANNSTFIPPGAYYESETGGASITSVSIIGDANGAQFVAKEW
jgi:hypothetical protein